MENSIRDEDDAKRSVENLQAEIDRTRHQVGEAQERVRNKEGLINGILRPKAELRDRFERLVTTRREGDNNYLRIDALPPNEPAYHVYRGYVEIENLCVMAAVARRQNIDGINDLIGAAVGAGYVDGA